MQASGIAGDDFAEHRGEDLAFVLLVLSFVVDDEAGRIVVVRVLTEAERPGDVAARLAARLK